MVEGVHAVELAPADQAARHRASRPCQAGPVPGTPDPPFGSTPRP